MKSIAAHSCQCTTITLVLVLCLSVCLPGVFVGISTARAATTDGWVSVDTGLANLDVYEIVVDPVTPSTVYFCASDVPDSFIRGGVFRTTDSGLTWTAASIGLTSLIVRALAIDPRSASTLYAGTNDGVFRSTDGATSWTASSIGLTGTYVASIAVNPITPSTLYASTLRGGVFRSDNSGATWTAVNTGLTDMNTLTIAIDPVTPSVLYVGTEYTGIFRSTDSGDHWMATSTGLTNMIVWAITVHPLFPAIIYAGTWRGIFRSTDRGITWTAAKRFDLDTRCLVVDPVRPNVTYASCRGAVYKSTDNCFTWTEIGNVSAGAGVKCIALASTAQPTLYAGTEGGGVFRYDIGTVAETTGKILMLTIGITTMLADGKPVSLEAAPVILNSRTLLPIRAVVEAVGGTIAWNASAQKVTITRSSTTLELWIGKNAAKLNGKSVLIDSNAKVVPIIKNGRTLLPLRFVAESLALDVQWDSPTQMITISYESIPEEEAGDVSCFGPISSFSRVSWEGSPPIFIELNIAMVNKSSSDVVVTKIEVLLENGTCVLEEAANTTLAASSLQGVSDKEIIDSVGMWPADADVEKAQSLVAKASTLKPGMERTIAIEQAWQLFGNRQEGDMAARTVAAQKYFVDVGSMCLDVNPEALTAKLSPPDVFPVYVRLTIRKSDGSIVTSLQRKTPFYLFCLGSLPH